MVHRMVASPIELQNEELHTRRYRIYAYLEITFTLSFSDSTFIVYCVSTFRTSLRRSGKPNAIPSLPLQQTTNVAHPLAVHAKVAISLPAGTAKFEGAARIGLDH
mmetsp:Transcript_22535/g.54478  ORF Transcript_22535/g.54478 Transcript_22535/m.54478 type:complete len:105 (+) Transcript_22535:276-590(+)